MVRIRVCKKCGWTDEKIKRELKRLRKLHPDEIDIQKKKCLDACKKGKAVRVEKKTIAPATASKLRRAVEKSL